MRQLLLALLLLGFLVSTALASGLSDIEKKVIQIEYIGRQVNAIVIFLLEYSGV